MMPVVEGGQLKTGVVVSAFAMALLCALVPFAIFLAGFAGFALARRGRPHMGGAVIALAALCTAVGISLRL